MPKAAYRKGFTALRASPPYCLLFSYCLVPCLAHWFSTLGVSYPQSLSFSLRSALLRSITWSKGKGRPSGSSPYASVMVVSFDGDCSAFQGTLTPTRRGPRKAEHRSHFLKDSFCYHRRNRPSALRPRPCFLASRPCSVIVSLRVTGGNKSRQFPAQGLLAEGGVSCLSSCLSTRICSLVFVAVLSALASVAGCAIARPGSAAPAPVLLSRLGGASPSRRTGVRRRFAPESERLASAPKSARGSAGASSPGMAIIPQSLAGRSFAASMPLTFSSQ
jgi:hypothetical protein